MADFIVRVLKWLAALVTAYFLLFVLLVVLLIGISIAFQPIPLAVEKDSILVLDLGFNLTDKPTGEDPAQLIRGALTGELIETASLKEVLDGLKKASNDADISGLLITGNLLSDGYGGSYASLREFRQAIVAFAENKPVWAHIEGDNLRDYYVKSAAVEVICDPHAAVDFRGLRAERIYWGEAFERIGIDVQIEAFEEFKTAGESYQEGYMSDNEREQLGSLISDMWKAIIWDIGVSRGVEDKHLDSIAGKELIVYGEEVTEMKLADQKMGANELIDYLAKTSGYDAVDETFQQYDFFDYSGMQNNLSLTADFMGGGSKIAVVYIEGILVDGKSSDGTVGAESIKAQLRKVRQDDSVKAVVLRINSPGGSAMASGRVVREIELTNAEKPVVVSMGGIAASAGYMMAAAGDYIFSEPTTITGSIGVVVMLPNVEKLADKLSLHFEGVETHPFAGTYSMGRAKNEEELRQIRALAEVFYNEFVQMVAANRGMTPEEIENVAKGRVWSGTAALNIGLVDQIGGLMSAVQRAADLASIGDDFDIIELPKAMTIEEKLEEILVGAGTSRTTPKGHLQSLVREIELEFKRLGSLDDPHGQYAILPYALRIK